MCVFVGFVYVWSVRPLLGSVHNYRADIQRKRCNPVKVRVCVFVCVAVGRLDLLYIMADVQS